MKFTDDQLDYLAKNLALGRKIDADTVKELKKRNPNFMHTLYTSSTNQMILGCLLVAVFVAMSLAMQVKLRKVTKGSNKYVRQVIGLIANNVLLT